MTRRTVSRRSFLRTTAAAAAAGLWLGERRIARGSPGEKLGIGVIGVGNRGAENLDAVAGEAIVALCDVDEGYLAQAAARFPGAAKYTDFRRMLERTDLDAVLVSTADHTHAAATLAALRSGRHVYCEKPLAHTVHEVHSVAAAAAKSKRATQMGIQIHANANYRRVVELVQTGVIGAVREVHVFVDKCWGGGALPAATDRPPVPSGLHFDLWLGPAAERPYHPSYHPQNWRRFWEFGGGTLADMACHHMDLPFWALELISPHAIEPLGPRPDPDLAPMWQMLRYEFPARGERPPVELRWYDGTEGVDRFLKTAGEGLTDWRSGTMFVGEKGRLVSDYTRHQLLPESDFAGMVAPQPFLPDSIGHHQEWIRACKEGGPTSCGFDYSSRLTEAVLLGIVAHRSGAKIGWNAAAQKASGAPEVDALLTRTYRPGWEI